MNPLLRPLYTAGTALARGLSAWAPASDAKLWRSFRARRGLLARWAEQVRGRRERSRPLVWLHAPSVGEGLQARPVAQALRALRPDVQIAYSFFSPSAERFATSIGADFTGYLPFDAAGDVDQLLEVLEPQALVFVKLDVWPVLVERATRRGVPVAMLSATLAAGSGRRSALSRALLSDAYAAMTLVGAIDADNGERLIELGVPRARLHVTGDTRFDQVGQRAQQVDRSLPAVRLTASPRPTLVAGSTWPADEAVLLPAWEQVRGRVPSARLIIAPHEPTAAHLEPLLAWGHRQGFRVERLGTLEAGGAEMTAAAEADVIVVDRVGVLGDLYANATCAFVGGGFHRAGLHSAIEPAAFGAPVLFGPGHHASREAGLLLQAGGAHTVANSTELTERLVTWCTRPEVRQNAGAAAQAVVERERGATQRSVALVQALLEPR